MSIRCLSLDPYRQGSDIKIFPSVPQYPSQCRVHRGLAVSMAVRLFDIEITNMPSTNLVDCDLYPVLSTVTDRFTEV